MGVRRFGRFLGTCVAIYAATVVAVTVAAAYWPATSALDLNDMRADAIICLGGSATHEALSPSTHQRAATCTDLYLAGAAPQIVMTGIVAAPLMADVAVAGGVPRDAILVEAESRSTLQNALFTADLLPDGTRVIVVTEAAHLPRSWISHRVMGFDDITLVASEMTPVRPRLVLREGLAIWFNAGRVVLWWLTPWLDAPTRAALLI